MVCAPGQPWPEPSADLTALQVFHSSNSLAGWHHPSVADALSTILRACFPVGVHAPKEAFKRHHQSHSAVAPAQPYSCGWQSVTPRGI